MNIYLAANLFEPNKNLDVFLISLINAAEEGKHRIFIRDESNENFINWKDSQSPNVQDTINIVLMESMLKENMGSAGLSICIHDGSTDWSLIPPAVSRHEAKKWMDIPVTVCLEDNISDRDFLLAMATHEYRKTLKELWENKLLEFIHCGGISGIPNKCIFDWPEAMKKKIFAIFDHDGLHPDFPSAQSNKAENHCKNNNISYHRLKRRSIENYLPLPTLRDYATSHGNGHIYDSFDHIVKDEVYFFYNIPHGFIGDQNRIRQGESSHGLFDDLSPQDRENLSKGFGDAIKKRFSSPIEEQSLLDDGGWQELQPIILQLIALAR
ncbi:MAG: hypothetical protein G8345_12645 [Magnetococcales bacterium]|nr:hypothetical protein [Magnetococcales bacterium]NGZ27723.1 hypothetical protein [Magnetococcales bacterium]